MLSYLAIAGGRFYCTGIPLSGRNFLRPDKGVMKRALEWGLFILVGGEDESRFELTEYGRQFLNDPAESSPFGPDS